MVDIYNNFTELAENERESVDYQIYSRDKSARFAIIAPHGGRIERGTSQVARAIAADDHACYCFEGLKDLSHDLHITSDRFDEPQALDIASKAEIVVTIHGAYGTKPFVYLGGLHESLRLAFIKALNSAGFAAERDPSPSRQGKGKTNICNRGTSKRGVQIEMTQGFRKSLFNEPDYQHAHWTPNTRFEKFVSIIREELKQS